MERIWQLQEAKNKFSSLVRKARSEGPQVVSKHGKEAVVVLAVEEFRRMTRPKQSLVQFMQDSPLYRVELDMERDTSPGRNVDL